MKSKGITDRLLRVILLQLVFISAITGLGVFVSAKVVEGVMMRVALEGEAKHFWDLFARNPNQALPNTDNLRGYLHRPTGSEDIPQALLDLKLGYGRVDLHGKNPLVMVEERNGHRLFLVFDEESVSRLSFYFGVVPLSLALMLIYFSAWVAFRQTRKAVSPVVKLANMMKQLDIESQTLDQIEFSGLGHQQHDSEVNVLVDALNGFTGRITSMLERERLFTRDASHELRTPLTVLQGSAEWLLMQPNLDERQQQVVQRVLRTSRDMTELVHALLVLARGEKVPPEIELVDVNKLVASLASELNATHNNDQHVELLIEQKNVFTCHTSRQVLRIVIANLLRNAFNYTHKGIVTASVENGSICISNAGEGVNADVVDKMFQPFYRGDQISDVDSGQQMESSAVVQTSQGYGVGLDIVKRLCEFMQWQIRVDFKADTGMRFSVEIPEQDTTTI